jgi:thiamine-phosphate pyrophosphorylase
LVLPPVYPILDTATLSRFGLGAIETARALLEGGAAILQYRHKGFWSREIVAEAEAIAELCAEAGVPFIVNDRADYAAIIGAGLHVGQEDLSPGDARRVVGTKALLGFSTHNPAQMIAAQTEPVDYVAFGPIFSTRSKERPDAMVGLEGLRAARALTSLPLVAIGGITLETAAECWEAGADSVALISALVPDPRARMADFVAIGTRHARQCIHPQPGPESGPQSGAQSEMNGAY